MVRALDADEEGVAVEVGQPRAKTVVAAPEDTIEATGGKVLVSSYFEALEGLLAGPGSQKVREEADCAVAVVARAAAAKAME